MARLFRLCKLTDRFDTQIFTFQLPASITRLGTPDVCSRDFTYGQHVWSISVIRSEKHIGIYLTLQNVTPGLSSTLDYTFTLLNSEHFSKNEVFVQRACTFTSEKPTQGRQNFIGFGDLGTRGFIHCNGDYLLELEMRNIHSSFEQVLQLSRNGKEGSCPRLETSYFSFGCYDWSLVLYPLGTEVDGRSQVQLVRQTNFDHICRVRYRLVIGQNERVVDSDTMDQLVDISGHGYPYQMEHAMHHLASSKGKLRVRVELMSVTGVSEVQVCPMDRARNRATLYDRDKQAWALESDISRSHLKLRLFYVDIRNVPRKCLRRVSFGVTVIPENTSHVRPTKAYGSPFSEYYSQNDPDDCFDITTEIPVERLRSDFLSESDRRLTVHVEWVDSHIVHHERYQRLDDVSGKHRHQMLREIMALQAENFALEKQLHSYQVSIAKTNAKALEEAAPKPAPREDLRRSRGEGKNYRR